MMTTLRKKPQELPTDVIDMLFACHERIRRMARLAERLSTAHESPAEEVQEAASALAGYFRNALPHHVADEDLSIRPRLHEIELPEDVRDALTDMSNQHEEIDELLADLLPLWDVLIRDGSRLPDMPALMEASSTRLRVLLDAHLYVEEETIFPAMRKYLSSESESVILREMRMRRGASEAPRALSGLDLQ